MKKVRIRRVLVGAVLICILMGITACRSEKSIEDSGTQNTNIEKASKVESKQLSEDSVVIAVGEEKATYQEVLVYMYILKDRYQDTLGNGIWDYEFGEGKTLKSMAIEQVVSMITEMKVINKKAIELGVDLTGDESEEIRQYASGIFKSISQEDIEEYHLSEEIFTKVYQESEIANKVYDACISGISTDVTEDQAKQVTVQYIYLQTSGINQSGVMVSLSEEEVQRRYEEAKTLRKRAKNCTDFYSFAKANTEADLTEITIGREDMCNEFTEVAFSLDNNELSHVVSSEDGFYIIYCVENNEVESSAAKREELIAAAQKENFEQQYEQWASEFEIEISKLIL